MDDGFHQKGTARRYLLQLPSLLYRRSLPHPGYRRSGGSLLQEAVRPPDVCGTAKGKGRAQGFSRTPHRGAWPGITRRRFASEGWHPERWPVPGKTRRWKRCGPGDPRLWSGIVDHRKEKIARAWL